MNTQKGVAPILLILLGLIVIGGGVYFYTQNPKQDIVESEAEKEDSLLIKEEDDAVAEQDIINSVLDEENIINTNTPSINKNIETEVVVSTPDVTSSSANLNCGSVLDDHFIFESDKRTSSEINALKCFSDAILNCSPAILNITGEDSGSYQVFGKDNNNCIISSTIEKNNKCEIPRNLIANFEKYSIEESEPIENLMIPIAFLMAFGEGTDTVSGESIKLSCYEY